MVQDTVRRRKNEVQKEKEEVEEKKIKDDPKNAAKEEVIKP